MRFNGVFPFSALVGQERLKLALMLNAVCPEIGGVLIRGEKGTAKSTAVRALAALLPEIKVVRGCPYSCDPERPDDFCEPCRKKGDRLDTAARPFRVVTLPLNATEDRVVGGIDFNLAVAKGRRIFQPGLLARAHRGFLYVDEVNLLDDHIVDLILDAAAMGQNVVEREGISFAHASRFVLVGTMNPEEGELRPQLLDRFGLCVEVSAEKELEKRADLMRLREEFDAGPLEFFQLYQEENEKIARKIILAREFFHDVEFPNHLRKPVAELCQENHVAGHRADLVIERAARAMAALNVHERVTVEDIKEVAGLALTHRLRQASPPPPPPPPPHDHDHQEDQQEQEQEQEQEELQEENRPEQPSPEQTQAGDQAEGSEPPDRDESAPQPDMQAEDQKNDSLEQIFEVGETFKVKKFASPKDKVFRRGSGRRSRTRIAQKQGRYVKSTLTTGRGDVALDATLRAAAPYQLDRKNGSPLAVILKTEDIREKVREKRIGNFLLFLVDASGSMGARGRMTASKGAVMSLLLDAYQKRDRVALISFRKDEAAVNLPPTGSIELAANLLSEMPVGGKTPLSAGLVKSYEVLRQVLLRDPTARPIVIVITDGKSNVALGDKKPLVEVLELAARISMDERIRFIVVDTEKQGLVNFGLARDLAGAMKAQYYKIEDLKADTLLNLVKENAR